MPPALRTRLLKLLLIFFLVAMLGCPSKDQASLSGPFLDAHSPLTPDEKIEILKYLGGEWQHCLGSSELPNQFSQRLAKFTNPFQLTLWHEGIRLSSFRSSGGSLKTDFKKAAGDACNILNKHKFTPKDLADLKVQISLAYDLQPLEEASFKKNYSTWESSFGIWGVLINGQRENQWWYPFDYLEQNLKFRKLFEKICGTGFPPKDCVKKMQKVIYSFKNFDFLGSLDPASYEDLYRLSPLVPIEAVKRDSSLEGLILMGQWFLQNIKPNGRMTYVYRPAHPKEVKTHNNMIRQFMATLVLFRLGNYLKDPELMAAAEKNLSYNLKEFMKVEEENKIAYIFFRKKAKLGAAAFALMSLMESQAYPDRQHLITYFTNLILQQQQPDGSFRTFYLPKKRNDQQNFYPGEAMLALMTLYESNPQAHGQLISSVKLAFPYYRDFFRKRPNPAFVPWQTMALFKLYQVTHDKELIEFIFEMNDFLTQIQNTPEHPLNSEQDTMGRFFDPKKRRFGPPHASSTAVYTEGLGDALRLAQILGDKSREQKYAHAIRWGLRSLFQLQYTPSNTFYIADKGPVVGALHTTVTNGNIRVDNTQHAAMAILKVLEGTTLETLVFNKLVH